MFLQSAVYNIYRILGACVVIDRVPSRISKPVAGSEGHQTAGMDRSDQGFHTFAISLPFLPSPDFLAPSNFISRPLPQLSIFPPLVPRATALCHKPLAGTHPAPFSVPFLRKTNSGNLCHRDMGITHFPTPLYCATLDDLPSFSRLSMAFFAPGLRLYHLELLFLLAQAHSEQLEHISSPKEEAE